jgi:hypothetical protein
LSYRRTFGSQLRNVAFFARFHTFNSTFRYRYDPDLVKDELRPLVFEQVRKQVDEEMRTLLENLKVSSLHLHASCQVKLLSGLVAVSGPEGGISEHAAATEILFYQVCLLLGIATLGQY